MNVSILELARDDLREIREYLLEFGESPPRKFRIGFEDFCENVAAHPFMFQMCEYAPDYRIAPVAFEYSAFYKVNEAANKVEVYRVLHGKRNAPQFLQ